jgi:hypothetical protein
METLPHEWDLCPYKGVLRASAMKEHRADSFCKEQVPSDAQSVGALILNFSAARIVRNEFMLL